jgi:hypothetical protein
MRKRTVRTNTSLPALGCLYSIHRFPGNSNVYTRTADTIEILVEAPQRTSYSTKQGSCYAYLEIIEQNPATTIKSM